MNPVVACNLADSCDEDREAKTACPHKQPHLPIGSKNCHLVECHRGGKCVPVNVVIVKAEREL